MKEIITNKIEIKENKFENHPCFNDKARFKFGRVHLPVAPRCNMQCNFCNRKFDCVNESRPGVTSSLLTPEEAFDFTDALFQRNKNISVVGIAGPGDPFANPMETMETFRRVKDSYPETMLCVATNGLNLLPYIDELAEMNVSHVTLTINAVDPEISAKIYAWMRAGKRVIKGIEAAKLLLERQLESVERLNAAGILVKVNSIIIPGVNDHHVPEVAEYLSKYNVDIFNAIAYYRNKESNFAHIKPPARAMVNTIREKASQFIPQMRHCRRCRADAVGLLDKKNTVNEVKATLKKQAKVEEPAKTESATAAVAGLAKLDKKYELPQLKNRFAVTTLEGLLVNAHLGKAEDISIFQWEDNQATFIEKRQTPVEGGGDQRWLDLCSLIKDCDYLFTSGIGMKPKDILYKEGIKSFELEGLIEESAKNIYNGKSINHLIKREVSRCDIKSKGGGGGCG